MAGFYDTLEEISDSIDSYFENLTWICYSLGWEFVLLEFIPGSKLLKHLAMDARWSREEAEACTESIGDKGYPEAVYNAQAAQVAVDIYRVAFNKHKYFWMRKT